MFDLETQNYRIAINLVTVQSSVGVQQRVGAMQGVWFHSSHYSDTKRREENSPAGNTVKVRSNTVKIRSNTVKIRYNTVKIRSNTVKIRPNTSNTVKIRSNTVKF